MATRPTGKERTLWRLSRARKLPDGSYLISKGYSYTIVTVLDAISDIIWGGSYPIAR